MRGSTNALTPSAGLAQAGVDRIQRDLELADRVRRDGPVRPHAHHAREVDEVAGADDMAVMADRLELPGNHEALDGHDVFCSLQTLSGPRATTCRVPVSPGVLSRHADHSKLGGIDDHLRENPCKTIRRFAPP
jgi:hypothetical protein